MHHRLLLRVVCALLVCSCLAACGSSNNNTTTTPTTVTAPTSLGVGDSLSFVFSDGSGRLDISITGTNTLGYVIKDAMNVVDDMGTAVFTWSASAAISTFFTSFVSTMGNGSGQATWTMTWTSSTAGSGIDDTMVMASFTYTAAP